MKKIGTVFDPLGLVSPFIVQAKIMLQELWSRGYDWDEEVQDEVANHIQLWLLQLSSLANISIRRYLHDQKPVKSKEVVTLVDASQQAYGALSYLRCRYEDGTVTSRLIISKSKVALLTPITVPRLELMAAIVGFRLTQCVSRTLGLPIKAATFYSDSTDVLWWIGGKGRDFRPFVANCIGEIQLSTEPSQWHVSTNENSADLCSRGTSAVELAGSQLWWNGAEWLMKARNEWPKDAASRKPKSHARNEVSKETGNQDYHMCGSAGKPTSNCGQAKSSYWLETEPNVLLKLDPINTYTCRSKKGSTQYVKDGRKTDQ